MIYTIVTIFLYIFIYFSRFELKLKMEGEGCRLFVYGISTGTPNEDIQVRLHL